ncbi:tektin-3 [Nasonia vitripennis]|uniref:Tektin n=1 Tax=Nasonia vitripennis TaxID=7425 RepID=A0A7M7J286_NASVI|nr:tektin-3 [Nasonia vitripennis]
MHKQLRSTYRYHYWYLYLEKCDSCITFNLITLLTVCFSPDREIFRNRMALFTPKNHPWKPTTGYETTDAFPVPSLPVTSQRMLPCYIPNGMCTAPLRFPNLVEGFNRSPIHAARAALSTRYESSKWLENHNSLMEEVSANLSISQAIRENLDNLVREEKEKLKACKIDDEGTKNTKVATLNWLVSKVDELSSVQEKVIGENEEWQDCRRKLQACIQGIEAPLQIAQECLFHRESRNKSELVNDKVEQMLLKEVETFRQKQKDLDKYLEQCEIQLIQGRKIQSELENFLRNVQWIALVDRSDKEIKRIAESKSWMEEFQCLAKKSDLAITSSKHLRKQIDAIVNEMTQDVLKTWNETNDAFSEKRTHVKQAIDEIEYGLKKIKNEIFNVEKNLKYLKTNKGIFNELQQGQDLLESLLRTKRNLESELSSKINSLFIDDKKCMTIRNCYPIIMTANH